MKQNSILLLFVTDISRETKHKEIANIKGPVYLRLARMKTGQIYDENQKFEIGKAVQIGEGEDGTIFATGVMVEQAIKAKKELKEKGIDYNLADKGLGQMGKIMLDFQWNSMRASQGWWHKLCR